MNKNLAELVLWQNQHDTGIISSDRVGLSEEEKDEYREVLKNHLNHYKNVFGIDYSLVQGIYKESGEAIAQLENSFFIVDLQDKGVVPGILNKEALAWKQDSAYFRAGCPIDPRHSNAVWYLTKEFDPNKLENYEPFSDDFNPDSGIMFLGDRVYLDFEDLGTGRARYDDDTPVYAGTFEKDKFNGIQRGFSDKVPEKGRKMNTDELETVQDSIDQLPESKLFNRVYNLRLLTEELGEETMDLFERVREGKVKFVDSQAYWISPSGEITSVGLKHINEIIDNPEAFGLTKEFVKETYAKFGEKMNTEGKAREEIMALLMKQGWIRIRYQPRQDSFTVQLWRLGRRPKDLIWSWANAQEESNSKRSYSDVVILLLGEDNRVIRTSVNGIVREELLDENEKKEAKRLHEYLKWVNSSSEFSEPSCYLSE